jgi:trk system potassium uptake protein TrkH
MVFGAICVTGLSVVVTATVFNRFGQTVILMRVQIGAIGLVTLSSALLLLVGEIVSLSAREMIVGEFGPRSRGGVVHLLRQVIIWSLGIEAAGALVLLIADCRRKRQAGR